MNSVELRQKRANLWEQAKALHGRPEAEKREWGAEDESAWNKLMTEIEGLGREIERQERLEAAENEARASRPAAGEKGKAGGQTSAGQSEEQRAFSMFLRGGRDALGPNELRALQVSPDTAGGFLVAPQQFVSRILQAVDNAVYIRQWATVFPQMNADSLGVASLDTDPADPTWTSELLIGSEDSSMAFGKRELKPNPLAKYIKLSNTLLRKVADVDALVIARLGYKFAVTAENAYLNGNGVGQPLGVFTASAMGVTTARDVSTGNTATAMTGDGLIEAKYTLKAAYWPRARWIFHRDGVKQIAKLKDGEGQYLWKPGLVSGEPDRLLNFPYYASEYAPNTFTASQYVGMLGDFSYYWIADALNMQIQRLVELYAATNQTGFIGRLESDGMPVLAEAFVRVKLGT